MNLWKKKKIVHANEAYLHVDLGNVVAVVPFRETIGKPERLEPGPHQVRLGIDVVAVLAVPIVQRRLHGRPPLGLQPRGQRTPMVGHRRLIAVRLWRLVLVLVLVVLVVIVGRRLGPPPLPQPQFLARVQHERRCADKRACQKYKKKARALQWKCSKCYWNVRKKNTRSKHVQSLTSVTTKNIEQNKKKKNKKCRYYFHVRFVIRTFENRMILNWSPITNIR